LTGKYDIKSIMHWSDIFIQDNNKSSIVHMRQGLDTIFSTEDISKINNLYGCVQSSGNEDTLAKCEYIVQNSGTVSVADSCLKSIDEEGNSTGEAHIITVGKEGLEALVEIELDIEEPVEDELADVVPAGDVSDQNVVADENSEDALAAKEAAEKEAAEEAAAKKAAEKAAEEKNSRLLEETVAANEETPKEGATPVAIADDVLVDADASKVADASKLADEKDEAGSDITGSDIEPPVLSDAAWNEADELNLDDADKENCTAALLALGEDGDFGTISRVVCGKTSDISYTSACGQKSQMSYRLLSKTAKKDIPSLSATVTYKKCVSEIALEDDQILRDSSRVMNVLTVFGLTLF